MPESGAQGCWVIPRVASIPTKTMMIPMTNYVPADLRLSISRIADLRSLG